MKKLVWLLAFGLLISTSGVRLWADDMMDQGTAKDTVAMEDQAPAKKYSCPMHPEVEQAEPGQCPKCGMDLVEQMADEDTQTSTEEDTDTRTAK